MLDYAALAVVFAMVTVAVPSMAADLVGGTVGLALASRLRGRLYRPDHRANRQSDHRGPQESFRGRCQSGRGRAARAATGADRHARYSNAAPARKERSKRVGYAATKVLNPFNGQPPGYN